MEFRSVRVAAAGVGEQEAKAQRTYDGSHVQFLDLNVIRNDRWFVALVQSLLHRPSLTYQHTELRALVGDQVRGAWKLMDKDLKPKIGDGKQQQGTGVAESNGGGSLPALGCPVHRCRMTRRRRATRN